MNRREFEGQDMQVPHSAGALNEIEAARYLSVSRAFLRQSRMFGDRPGRAPGPPFLKIGRMIRYRVADLESWLARFAIERGTS